MGCNAKASFLLVKYLAKFMLYERAFIDHVPVDLDTDPGCRRHVQQAVFIKVERVEHREGPFVVGCKQFKEFAVLGSAGHMKIRYVSRAHACRMKLTIQAESFG